MAYGIENHGTEPAMGITGLDMPCGTALRRTIGRTAHTFSWRTRFAATATAAVRVSTPSFT
jgi:hypothetical protein